MAQRSAKSTKSRTKTQSREGRQTKSKSRSTSRGRIDNVLFQMLKEDHDKVKDLFEELEEDGDMEAQEDLFS